MSPGAREGLQSALRQLRGARSTLFDALHLPGMGAVLSTHLSVLHARMCALEKEMTQRAHAAVDDDAAMRTRKTD